MMLFMASIKLQDLKIGFTDQFFFDTNVWLLLYSPVGNFQLSDQKQYSKLFEELLTKDSAIFITSMILSEISNVQLRFVFKQWITTNKLVGMEFKRDFVGTAEYKNAVTSISELLKKILKLPNIHLTGDNFNAINKDAVLSNFVHIDFNDSYVVELAILNNYRIVTNDTDFLKLANKIDIISTKS